MKSATASALKAEGAPDEAMIRRGGADFAGGQFEKAVESKASATTGVLFLRAHVHYTSMKLQGDTRLSSVEASCLALSPQARHPLPKRLPGEEAQHGPDPATPRSCVEDTQSFMCELATYRQ